jgi:hypothetical protein
MSACQDWNNILHDQGLEDTAFALRYVQSTKTEYNTEDYEKLFGQLISYTLGSDKVDQDLKNQFINNCLLLDAFRTYVKTYFPQYTDKVVLWEKLHHK